MQALYFLSLISCCLATEEPGTPSKRARRRPDFDAPVIASDSHAICRQKFIEFYVPFAVKSLSPPVPPGTAFLDSIVKTENPSKCDGSEKYPCHARFHCLVLDSWSTVPMEVLQPALQARFYLVCPIGTEVRIKDGPGTKDGYPVAVCHNVSEKQRLVSVNKIFQTLRDDLAPKTSLTVCTDTRSSS